MGIERAAVMVTAFTVLAGCAGYRVPDTVDPDAAGAAIAATAPDRPLRLTFEWRILDGDARFSGSGVARVEPPMRARLDLFGPRGDGYLSAAMVGAELRMPPGTDASQLPPAGLMWAVLGVVAPPDGAELMGTRVEGEETELHYGVAERTRIRYTLERDRLREVLWEDDGRKLVVELRGDAEFGMPEEAVYRDWSRNTELMLNLERVDESEPYPPETWMPDR